MNKHLKKYLKKKSKIRFGKEFINEIETDGKCINDEILWKYFKY